jgi:hypothetical protein
MTRHASTALRTWSRAVITRAALVVAASAGLLACSGDSSTGPGAGKSAGLYELQNVDQSAPPTIIHKGPWLDKVNTRFYNLMVMTVTGGTIEVEDDGWFYMTFNLDYNADGNRGTTSLEIEGEWKQFGDKIDLIPEGNPNAAWSAIIRNGAIALPLDMMNKGVTNTYTFRR